MSRPERELAHLAFDTSEIAAVAAGDDTFLKSFVKDPVMKRSPLRRGE